MFLVSTTFGLCFVALGQNAVQMQSRLDSHCLDAAKEFEGDPVSAVKVGAFYSFKTSGCVLVEADDAGWSYDLRDFTHSLFVSPKWVAVKSQLNVYHDEKYGYASVEGYWQSTDKAEDKQLVSKIAAKISCLREENTCRESDATIFMGFLKPDTHDYPISSWNDYGIVADDPDEGSCGIGHRLSIDFVSNSVTVTDYPKSIGVKDCEAFQNANSYALQGGDLLMYSNDQLFSCTKDGSNSVILQKVHQLHGDVSNIGYEVWMDNGSGGKPATIKTPSHPYTREECKRLLDTKIAELKAM